MHLGQHRLCFLRRKFSNGLCRKISTFAFLLQQQSSPRTNDKALRATSEQADEHESKFQRSVPQDFDAGYVHHHDVTYSYSAGACAIQKPTFRRSLLY